MIGISLGNSSLGRLAIDALLEMDVAPSHIVAVVRSPEKAKDLAVQGVTVRVAEYGDRTALESAFAGTERLYMISGMSKPEERKKQHRGVIEAAKIAGVKAIVYTSFIDTADNSPFFAWSINRDTEAALKESGLEIIVLRNGMYSEADLDFVPNYLEAGKVENNIGFGRISYISRRDLSLAAACCLKEDGHAGHTYTLTGPEAITQSELAASISKWTGQVIPYVCIADDEYRKTFPDPYWGDVVVTLYQSVRAGNCDAVIGDFKKIVGRNAYTLDETWNRFYA